MNIVMMTNTYLPHVGGVARSVESFRSALRELGHDVLVVAPTFEDMPRQETDVVRVPAVQRFNGSDFSVRLPIPGLLSSTLDVFKPDIVHSHHPFMLGDTALRTAARRSLPLVFTNHTLYERYTHYVPGDSEVMRDYVKQMAVEYANLCDHVVAPSDSILRLLRDRGVSVPISAIPTGIDPDKFAQGDGSRAREQYEIPPEAFVVGHVGRLAPEKNLGFLAGCVADFLVSHGQARFLVVGEGPSEQEIRDVFAERGVSDRLHMAGQLDGQKLTDAYHAMQVFAFASQTETQGMVLAEAMTAGIPVVAVDASGVREVVRDGENGILLDREEAASFVGGLEKVAQLESAPYASMVESARSTARSFSLQRCTDQLASIYQELLDSETPVDRDRDNDPWNQILHSIEKEWKLWSSRAEAAVTSIKRSLKEEWPR